MVNVVVTVKSSSNHLKHTTAKLPLALSLQFHVDFAIKWQPWKQNLLFKLRTGRTKAETMWASQMLFHHWSTPRTEHTMHFSSQQRSTAAATYSPGCTSWHTPGASSPPVLFWCLNAGPEASSRPLQVILVLCALLPSPWPYPCAFSHHRGSHLMISGTCSPFSQRPPASSCAWGILSPPPAPPFTTECERPLNSSGTFVQEYDLEM